MEVLSESRTTKAASNGETRGGCLGIFEQKVDRYLFWYAEASAMRLFGRRPLALAYGVSTKGKKSKGKLECESKPTNSGNELNFVRKCLVECCRRLSVPQLPSSAPS